MDGLASETIARTPLTNGQWSILFCDPLDHRTRAFTLEINK